MTVIPRAHKSHGTRKYKINSHNNSRVHTKKMEENRKNTQGMLCKKACTWKHDGVMKVNITTELVLRCTKKSSPKWIFYHLLVLRVS